MKKRFLLGSLVCVMALVLAGAAFAVGHENTGHVGHINDSIWEEYDPPTSGDLAVALTADNSSAGGGEFVAASLDVLSAEEAKARFTVDNIGAPAGVNVEMKEVFVVFDLAISHDVALSEDVKLDLSSVDPDGEVTYVFFKRHDADFTADEQHSVGSLPSDGKFVPYKVVNGVVTIPLADAPYIFSGTTAVATATTPVSASDDSSGGCNMGIFAPAAVLLLAPLALLLKR